ncbi:hypothetical protein [Paenibacillus agricola]|uniref:Uncharacterized protein n=1 Tax=Paenibacillus agricola TaxID=2716264 RepID=A0ABX0JE38_9BACL|nr:hypothetical protein [Paenibacillus agricola]NHN34397.1 hypothetical protein [Paenibacillus agricola]
MIQTNSIWVVESKKQLDTLHALKSKLRYKAVVLESECDITTLPSYDMVFFLLTPTKIGNKFFIEAIKEVLSIRQNSKTIFMAIDDCYRLDEQELMKVTLELKSSIKYLISNPAVFMVSSYFALLHLQYELKQVTLEDIQHNREVMIPNQADGMITGLRLKVEHMSQLLQLSRMDKIYLLIEEFSKGVRNTGIDTTKQNWLILGPDKTGKSLLTKQLQASIKASGSFHFADKSPIPDDIGRYYDGIVIVLDLDINRSLAYLERICSTYVGLNKIIVVNKSDDFMFYRLSQSKLQTDMMTKLRFITSDPVFFVSAYYYEQYIRLSAQEVTMEDIIQDSKVVFADPLNFPIAKETHRAIMPELLLVHSGFNNLLQNWE